MSKSTNMFIPKTSNFILNQGVELRRNIFLRPFPDKNTSSIKELINTELQQLLLKENNQWQQISVSKSELNPFFNSKNTLFINKEEIGDSEHSYLFYKDNQFILTNSEDHIKLISFQEDNDKGYLNVNPLFDLEEKLNAYFNFSFSPEFGYLSSNPLNCGLGLKLQALLHLPAITLLEKNIELGEIVSRSEQYIYRHEISKNIKGANLYRLTNPHSFNVDEQSLISNFHTVIKEILELENEAKIELKKKYYSSIKDKIYRSLGIMGYATEISYQEVLNLTSFLRLGIDYNIFPVENIRIINEIQWETTSSQSENFETTSRDEGRNIMENRAEYIKHKLQEWV